MTVTIKTSLLVLSVLLTESFAANWTTVWTEYKKEPPVDTTMVFVNLFVRSIKNVNTNDMTFDAQLTYREQWRDPRLAYDEENPSKANSTFKVFGHEKVDRKHIWTPDSFFSNEISGYDFKLMSENSLVRVYPNGEILMSRRIQLKLSCPMNLKSFPFDEQVCSINIASYGYTTDQIVYLWKKSDPIQVTKTLHLPDFTLTKFRTDYCTSKTNTGEYSCLVAFFTLERSSSPYVYQVFMPVLMLVILAYMTAWIQDAAARAVLLSIVFALALLAYCGLSFVLPRTTYFKMIDNFLVISLIFIFGIVVKFAIDWSRWRTFEKKDSLSGRDILTSIWYPVAYVFIVITYILNDLS